MKLLNEKEIENVNGGIIFTMLAVAAGVATLYGAYNVGKSIGSDIVQGMNNS